MNAAYPPQTTQKKRSALSGLAITLLGLFGTAFLVVAAGLYFFSGYAARKSRPTQARHVISDLRMAILSYQVDYNHLPIPEPVSHETDITIRSSGPLLTALLGRKATKLNTKSIKFYDGPFDSDSKYGLWQNGDEWILRDRWGEPYYIVFDANGDGKIANPEFTTDPPGSKEAEKRSNSPLTQTFSDEVIIYSSGPDRDPKTWQDNIGSWHPELERD